MRIIKILGDIAITRVNGRTKVKTTAHAEMLITDCDGMFVRIGGVIFALTSIGGVSTIESTFSHAGNIGQIASALGRLGLSKEDVFKKLGGTITVTVYLDPMYLAKFRNALHEASYDRSLNIAKMLEAAVEARRTKKLVFISDVTHLENSK